MYIKAIVARSVELEEAQMQGEYLHLMKKHGGIIGTVMKKYRNLIDYGFREDFEQEVRMMAWKNFHRYDPLVVGEFGRWLWQAAEWAILKFSKKTKRNGIFLSEWFLEEYPDDSYEEDHIEGLHRAIMSFDDPDREIFLQYVSGRNLAEISIFVSMTIPAVSHRLQRGYQRIRNEAPRFFEVVPKMEKDPATSRRGSNNHLSKSVSQFSMDGQLIKTFSSAGEAGRCGFEGRRVMEVAAGKKKSYKGYYWRIPESAVQTDERCN